MHIKLLTIAAAVALAFGTAQAQQRQDTTKEGKPTASSPAPERNAKADGKRGDRQARKAEEDRIEADAKAAKAKCDGMDGKQKDLCQQEAKSNEKVAKAELDAKYDPTPRKVRKVEEQKAEAKYEVAKARCDLQKNDDACKKQARAEYDRAKADIKAKHAKSDAKRDRTAGTGATGSDNTPNRDLNRNGK